ncbi:hypothetical protein [Actinacidiphila reveromycinica]|nr:hypothetical protein [Streptomyces sp. SN-593]
MTSAPHLLTEDRPDFEHVLDEALHIALGGTGDGAAGSPLNAEQLRTMALAAAESIGARAAEEYEVYRRVRADSREAVRESARVRDSRAFSYAAMGVADRAGSGPGLLAVMAVLTPLLAGAAALIFLLIGYALEAVSPEPGIASPLRTAGWFFAAVTAAAIVLGGIGLLLTALRDGSSAIRDTPDALPSEVAQAREAWRRALLDRGLLPFLDDALAGRAGVPPPAAPASVPRMPRLGYTRPDFSSPQDPHHGTVNRRPYQ